MSLSIGTKLGSLEVLAVIGRGGMGEVYRARDTKLKRDVAIKTLPDEFLHDADRLSRFQREAEVLASLNHPNIAAIYDLQEGEGSRFLVLELVEGETLADRIERGPIPIDEALPIAKGICEALEAAHEQGIVHRDLKPANIKITADGKVKVLDFGLAKAMESVPSTTMSNSPTLLSVAASNVGVILGTAAYMSPEQAKGKTVDKRADIWAFGVVLYEMLTSRQLFTGETVSETMAFVITREPDWSTLPANLRQGLRELLRKCLIKDPRNRIRDIGDVRIALEEGHSGVEDPGVTQRVPLRRENALLLTVLAVLIVVAAAMAFPLIRHLRDIPPLEIRLEVNTARTSDPFSFAISPDGQRLAFVAIREGKSQLWVRPLDSVTPLPLPGTEGASFPFWSPDSQTIGFFADDRLKRIDISGGAPQVLATAVAARGGTWSERGVIVFAPTPAGPLFKISAKGGEAVPVTKIEPKQVSHRFPQFLPDGEHFIYFIQGPQEVYVGSLGVFTPKRLMNADAAVAISSSGFLFFSRQTTLFAQEFDFKKLELVGDAFSVAEQVPFEGSMNARGFSVTSAVVAYRNGSADITRQLMWLDRSGKTVGTVGDPDASNLYDVDLSPDGKRALVTRSVSGNTDVWLIDTARGVPTRFTFDPSVEQRPIWSQDGSRIIFNSTRAGPADLYWKSSSGAGPDELLLKTGITEAPNDFSPNGRFLIVRAQDPKTGYDLWILPMFGDKKAFPFLNTLFDERDGQFSPDGKWIAYQSNESGKFEIYVQPFPGPGGKFQISTNGGAQPRWNKNGKEIFYVSLDSKMMAAPVKLSPDGRSLETDAPAALFPVRIAGGPLPGFPKQQYAVSSDGQRFLVNVDSDAGSTSPITIIYNWHPPKP